MSLSSLSRALIASSRRLSPLPHSDTHALLPGPYLNASFIPSLSPSSSTPARTFICSQAPLPHTYSTFYASLAAHSTRVLVNLTPLQENGRAKSDAYWPDAGAGWVDEYAEDGARWRIRTAEERQLGAKGSVVGELTRRVLQLERVGKGGKADKKHQVVMLHLTTWPDHGAASSRTFQALLQAIDAECAAAPAVPNAKAKGAVPPGSVWVHCSAGVGRSGTVVGALLARDSPEAVVALSTGAPPPSPPASAAAKQSSVKSILKPFKSRHSPSHSSGTSPALSTTPAAAAETQLHLPSAAIAASAIVRHMRERRARMVQTAAQLAMLTAEVERVLGAQQQV